MEQEHVVRACTTSIVAGYVSNNKVPVPDIPALIEKVYQALLGVDHQTPDLAEPKPAISVRKSVTPDYIICLEDGGKYKTLKRHLRVSYKMTPDQYRAKWRLPPDYPMVAPNYSRSRSGLAKSFGLGLTDEQRVSRDATAMAKKEEEPKPATAVVEKEEKPKPATAVAEKEEKPKPPTRSRSRSRSRGKKDAGSATSAA